MPKIAIRNTRMHRLHASNKKVRSTNTVDQTKTNDDRIARGKWRAKEEICTYVQIGTRRPCVANALRGNVDGRTRKDLERVVNLLDLGNQLLLTLDLRTPVGSTENEG